MNKKILVIAVSLIFVAMIVTPVLAIGPQKAVKTNNPNAYFMPWGVQLRLPSGVFNEWISYEPIHIQIKSPSDFNLGHFNVPANPSEIVENKWNFLSEEVFMQYLMDAGFPEEDAYYIAYIVYAGGVYYKAEHVGN